MISWKRMDELRAELGDDDFEEVVGLFLDEVEGALQRLAATQSASALQEDLHALRGSALNLGMQQLATLCREAETMLERGDPGLPDIAPIAAAFDASRALLAENRLIATG
ncbi:MAG: Hpt domain-containing protein [Rhodobacteraceae bacterium]|nr:Hpt domain-containing protein [Alphaproteobacteria bacterium]NNK66304.1 Hpt domain-containing protein [Paracoccaceae bacterium]